ncbi:MAG: hypothetical protein A3H98_02005 [Bacteroidetes bacterium RIFCSPLOWO2_02_FULL_36_8]|nr:MAG: hypothetical protein A3H98_02005 [Bacteroidetes bacterium RIFCSPLOWO2_02_FULL_36_8]OFY70643.1 MAG: hypothetical protein A3G23_07900 [Bacteroidetes bacterium RIFCSPLOWO2_12_FULL_37_12]
MFYSCKKEEPTHFYIPQIVKDYAAYKPGSYWIYSIDSTEVEDSVFVSDYKEGETFDEGDENYEYSEIRHYISSDLKNKKGEEFFHVGIGSRGISYEYNWEGEAFHGLDFWYLDNGKFILEPSSYNNKVDTLTQIETSNLFGKTYKDIVYCKDVSILIRGVSDSSKMDTIELWVAKHTGIIKRVMSYDSFKTTYVLKRHNVIQ